MDAGLSISQTFPGTVPEFECREAAIYVRVSWSEWLELEHEERAAAVAHYRLNLLIKAHVDSASQEAAKRNERRNRKRN